MVLDIEIRELVTFYVDVHPAIVVAAVALVLIVYALHLLERTLVRGRD
jgi:hypothetical protein